MKEFSILSQLKYIIFTLLILASSIQYTNAQSPIQTQLGSTIKFIVAKDGSGNYTTVQAAINAIPNNSTTSQVIFIKKGTYTEKVEIPSTKTHLVLIGEDVATTIIAYGDYSGSGKIYNGIITSSNGTAIGTSTSHTLFAAAADFTMMNITIANTAGDVGQAVALNSNADRQFYYHCKITGHQDTYLTWAAARYYLKDCYLEGAVDYIFGGGVTLFDSCQLNSVRSGTCITAASTGQNFKFGYVFQNCKITSNSGVTDVFLGRPWYPYCQVVFMNSEESSVIDPAGWSKWSGNNNDQTCYYAEYKNCGAGSSITNRATWTHQLTATQAATYTRSNIFDKSVNPTPYAASWDPNPEGNTFYAIVNKNTTPFITSACFAAVTPPAPSKKYIYTYDNSGNLSWNNTNSWAPKSVPTAIDTVIIRTGEVQIANLNHTAPMFVETNGTLRLIDTSTVVNLHLQGGTLKVSTSAPGMMLTSNITVEQPSTILAGSVAATIFTINGTITGNANLTKTSVGNLRINSTATDFKGNWIITGGKLQLRSASGLGVCGVQVKNAARLDIEAAGASIYSLVIEETGGVDLDQPLAVNVAVLGTTNIMRGAYQNAAYPTYIGSTGTLNVSNNLVTLSGTTTFCNGNNLILTASSGTGYIWKNNTIQVSTSTTYTTAVAGSYTIDATSSVGCKATSAPVVTIVNALPMASITAPATSFCAGGSVILTASTGASYKWFNGTIQIGTASTYTTTTAGTYTVEVTNAAGCKATSAAIQISIASTVTWYADADNDGLGDVSSTINSCTKPNGYVAIAGDACPTDAHKSDAGNCGCGNTEASCLDCAGTPNGAAFLDNCSVCAGGTTGNTACVTTATVNGTSANITVIPQPFDASTTITVENYGTIQSFTIISASGILVETRQELNTTEITIGQDIAPGLYTVIITTEKGIYTTKIVKK
jgi:pectin methylesterase-like acyl-CoA thioesterase